MQIPIQSELYPGIKEASKRTLQPSHLFLTELIVFMLLACSAILFCTNPSLITFCTAGRRNIWVAIEERHLAGVEVRRVDVVGRANEGKSACAVRRKVVVGTIFGRRNWTSLGC